MSPGHYSRTYSGFFRGVARGGAEGARAPPEFGRSVNPIQTRGGRLCPYVPLNIRLLFIGSDSEYSELAFESSDSELDERPKAKKPKLEQRQQQKNGLDEPMDHSCLQP